MNIYEGITRLTRLLRWIGNGTAILLLLLSAVVAFNGKTQTDLVGPALIALAGASVWALCYAAAWILDGFVAPKA